MTKKAKTKGEEWIMEDWFEYFRRAVFGPSLVRYTGFQSLQLKSF